MSEQPAPAISAEQLPKQYDHTKAQQEWYPFWERQGYFHSDPNPAHTRSTKGPFTVVIPPPNVTGALHLGHALNNTLQDMLVRFKRMQGFNALWMPGTDHAGIATQAVVERRLREEEGLDRHALGREKLVERIWQWKKDYEARILSQLKQMGCSCDWRRTRFTLDEMCARAVRQTFFSMFKDNLIFRGKRLVNWDTYLQTAVADDEVYHDTIKGHFWHFRYPVIDPQPGEPTHVTIATTRPETMLGDTAVAVHPDPSSALDKAERELREKLAQAPAKEKSEIQKQLDDLADRRQNRLPELIKLRDMAKAGRKLMLPLANREIPLIADMWAKPELGSGCVKITPAHDENDYQVWQRHKEIGAINIMAPDGTLNENVPEKYRGLKMHTKGREAVVADLIELGLHNPETDRENREIDLAHSDRSKTPIEPYLADQWFVKMSDNDGKPGLAQLAMDAVDQGDGETGKAEGGRVKITPPRYAKSYLDWLGEKRDWCIGRQLWWGHRVPIWSKVHQGDSIESIQKSLMLSCGDIFDFGSPDETQIRVKAGYQEKLNAKFKRGPGEDELTVLCCIAPGNQELESRLESVGFTQDTDVLDTWFSSALWPHSTLGWPGPAFPDQPAGPSNPQWSEQKYYYPTSVLITSRDIITLWVARMVLTGLYNIGEVPFHDVYIHPKILDGYGETMSKSKGNGVDPLDIISKFGADALRFALAYLCTETQDVRMPVEFECPHCGKLIEQTQKNRTQPKIDCKHCGKAFSTQWATKPDELALARGAVVSERFEFGRNFCNKMWNAARFALINLEGYAPGTVALAELSTEDKWILSRLTTVTQQVTKALEQFKFADVARLLYDFAWDEFCSFYLEMAKTRLQDPETRATAQRILAHTLDTILRLLHPITPFITEDVWQRLNVVAPSRGLVTHQSAAESVMIANWPEADSSLVDEAIEARFARFQEVLSGLREVRARHGIAPKAPLQFDARCDEAAVALLDPMRPYFESMAGAIPNSIGPNVTTPAMSAHFTASGIDVYVDLADHIDVDQEIARKKKEEANFDKLIAAKEKQLSNEAFVSRAPENVIAKERAALEELRESRRSTQAILEQLSKIRAKST